VVDIFSGSNTTGYVAEREQREWMAFDSEIEYVAASVFRFLDKGTPENTLRSVYQSIKNSRSINLPEYRTQMRIFREDRADYQLTQAE